MATLEGKPHAIFIPVPAQSHIKAMLKLARLLHHKGILITFINTESNHKCLKHSGGPAFVDHEPGFQFKTIPDGLGSMPDDRIEPTQTLDSLFNYLGSNFLGSFLEVVGSLESPPTVIVSDAFMTFANTIGAAEVLKIPIVLYWTLAACGVMGFYQAQALKEKGFVPLKDESYLSNGYLETEINWIPGMEGVRLKELPHYVRATKPDDPIFNYVLHTAQAADKVSHMIIHTFDELEAPLVKELKSMFPKVYTIGPLQLLLNQTTKKETKKPEFNGYSLRTEEPECLKWLESKEPNSVVYVNFGSLTTMSLKDLLEFGWGLVNSKCYFLWIIRANLVDGESLVFPLELENEIKKRGFIASWCSQEEVLNHPSVGGFVTHGGWGSIIESLSAGVPMICWPDSWDQLTNCRQMCKEWGVGMEIGRNVKREEVERLVRELMEGVEGSKIRKKAIDWKNKAEIATSLNGSSFLNVEKLVDEIVTLSRN